MKTKNRLLLKGFNFILFRTTDEKFIPKPVQPKAIFHSLVDLLNNVRSLFLTV
jgi:hypothetical protein